MRKRSLLFALPAALLLSGTLFAQRERERHVAFLDPEKAGPDFKVQGEYVGTIGEKAKVAAQVIALGSGKFSAVLYSGGLPGAGWDGITKIRLTGAAEGDETTFTGKNFKGTIKGDTFSGAAEEGVQYELKKIERKSWTLDAKPPEGAIVLFDGSNVDAWENGRLQDGNLLGVGTRTRKKFSDFTLHLEFQTPFMPTARGQDRGNSGMYLGDQYEVQILDSFGLEGVDNECGGIYKVASPKVNMCLPPLAWQTYDVEFQAARFDRDGKKTNSAVATIRHNGVVIHENLALDAPTPGGHQSDEKPGALFLQNHNDPVRFRNIWIVEKK
jgi:hypothetical protein